MPIEYALLKDKPSPFEECPCCHERPFEPFLRGQVQRAKYSLWSLLFSVYIPRTYCAVICSECKMIVGYEKP